MANPSNYYDLKVGYKLGGHPTDATTTMSQEGFSAMLESYKNPNPKIEQITNMSDTVTTIPPNHNTTDVIDPYAFGYIPTLNETRVQNSLDIVNQESMLFSIGAITGVSMIVLGIIITSNSN